MARHATDEATTDEATEYRCDGYDKYAKPVERPTGEAGPAEATEHRSYDYEQLIGQGGKVLGTAPDTKVIKPADKNVGIK